MPQVLTSRDVRELQDVVRIDDLLLLPRARLPHLAESLALQKAGIIDVESSMLARNQLSMNLVDMQSAYSRQRQAHGSEPAWIREVPLHTAVHLRHWYAVTQEDPVAIILNVPHTALSYMIVCDGMTEDVMRLFNLWRLQGVNQLGFLQAPWVMQSDWPLIDRLTHVNRYLHSCDVATIGTVIGRNLGLSDSDRNTLRTACLTHDWGTPAGGDSVKLVDLKGLDEDLNYRPMLRERLDQSRWLSIREQYGIDEELLCKTVLNEGLLGSILDVADKLAYVARDIDTCLHVGASDSIAEFDFGEAYVGTRALKEILDEYPNVCDIWDSVRCDGDRLVFTNVPRLIAFLKARVVLFRELYFHPRARFGEYLISRLLVKKLYDRGVLTRELLLEMNDHDLERVLEKEYGKQQIIRALSTKSQVSSFKTRNEAIAYKTDLEKAGVPLVLLEDHLQAIKPGTHVLVDSQEGVMPFLQAYPGDARELHEMATMLPAVHVYYVADSKLSPAERQGYLELQA